MKTGIYAGSFDPITLGHIDIIERASKMVDLLLICVMYNPNKKSPLFEIEQRLDLIRQSLTHVNNIKIEKHSGLLVEYAKKTQATINVRGLRTLTDFEYEMQMAQINKTLYDEMETIFLISNPKYSFISSSGVRELVIFNGKIDNFVPKIVLEAIHQITRKKR
ncbi:pantetheine-phosphate adenylyltransferase [Candidatus Epulonipiscium fishelsonii]|uniref:Pantetheine-phosphate adenylyltransferase n=1 Tax=Candidatus Epulonipiscium fishelsonii TaxID=77094 RepID=A0ACC8XFM6_9FIRM|nr:pantetheine-phosphate adenylyltransferase [Epulopiscium sp. SCG-B11WGA-EpuloA1]ONI42879.1 pantetheine-phosphate adenylyltransferase [Epulopiscium sp. SCG-B05WGA-EpuloA1]